MSKELYVVNEDMVVVDKIESQDSYVKLSDGDRVLRKGLLTYLSDTTDIKYRFIKVNPIVHKRIANKYPIINKLIEYVGYMDNELRFRNGKVIKTKNMEDICDVSESTVKRQLKGLISEDIIHKVKNGKETVFVVNPFYVMRGRRIYLSLYEEFKLSALRGECEMWEK